MFLPARQPRARTTTTSLHHHLRRPLSSILFFLSPSSPFLPFSEELVPTSSHVRQPVMALVPPFVPFLSLFRQGEKQKQLQYLLSLSLRSLLLFSPNKATDISQESQEAKAINAPPLIAACNSSFGQQKKELRRSYLKA